MDYKNETYLEFLNKMIVYWKKVKRKNIENKLKFRKSQKEMLDEIKKFNQELEEFFSNNR